MITNKEKNWNCSVVIVITCGVICNRCKKHSWQCMKMALIKIHLTQLLMMANIVGSFSNMHPTQRDSNMWKDHGWCHFYYYHFTNKEAFGDNNIKLKLHCNIDRSHQILFLVDDTFPNLISPSGSSSFKMR